MNNDITEFNKTEQEQEKLSEEPKTKKQKTGNRQEEKNIAAENEIAAPISSTVSMDLEKKEQVTSEQNLDWCEQTIAFQVDIVITGPTLFGIAASVPVFMFEMMTRHNFKNPFKDQAGIRFEKFDVKENRKDSLFFEGNDKKRSYRNTENIHYGEFDDFFGEMKIENALDENCVREFVKNKRIAIFDVPFDEKWMNLLGKSCKSLLWVAFDKESENIAKKYKDHPLFVWSPDVSPSQFTWNWSMKKIHECETPTWILALADRSLLPVDITKDQEKAIKNQHYNRFKLWFAHSSRKIDVDYLFEEIYQRKFHSPEYNSLLKSAMKRQRYGDQLFYSDDEWKDSGMDKFFDMFIHHGSWEKCLFENPYYTFIPFQDLCKASGIVCYHGADIQFTESTLKKFADVDKKVFQAELEKTPERKTLF